MYIVVERHAIYYELSEKKIRKYCWCPTKNQIGFGRKSEFRKLGYRLTLLETAVPGDSMVKRTGAPSETPTAKRVRGYRDISTFGHLAGWAGIDAVPLNVQNNHILPIPTNHIY